MKQVLKHIQRLGAKKKRKSLHAFTFSEKIMLFILFGVFVFFLFIALLFFTLT